MATHYTSKVHHQPNSAVTARNPFRKNSSFLDQFRFPVTLLLAGGVLLSGCQTQPPPPPPPEPTPASNTAQPTPEPPAMDPERLYDLLDQAEAAIARDHLSSPVAGSALSIYQEILAIDQDQEEARRGLEHIVEKYIELAMSALDRGQYATARSMLARARLIMPDHPSIAPTEEQILLLLQARRTRVRLNQSDLDAQTETITNELHNLAATPADHQCRFYIAAKNDAQGRWIYRTLSAAAPETRLKAQIDLRLPAQVERVCFPE